MQFRASHAPYRSTYTQTQTPPESHNQGGSTSNAPPVLPFLRDVTNISPYAVIMTLTADIRLGLLNGKLVALKSLRRGGVVRDPGTASEVGTFNTIQ